jgi:hypothetical protein
LLLAPAALSGQGFHRGRCGEVKVFWFFFSKKNISSTLPEASGRDRIAQQGVGHFHAAGLRGRHNDNTFEKRHLAARPRMKQRT